MIKKALLAVALMIPMLMSAQNLKLGVLDFNDVLANHPDTAVAQQTLSDTQKEYEKAYNQLGEEMKRLYDEFQNMGENTLPAIRERKARDITDYQQKMQDFEQKVMQDMQRKQSELMQPIISQIQQAVESVGKENGYSLIQIKDQQVVLFYQAPVDDVTPLVKAKLNIK